MNIPISDPRFDNPLWATLGDAHRQVARGDENARRYDAAVLPFVAVPDAGECSAAAIEALCSRGDEIYLVGVYPPLTPAWQLLHQADVAQLVYPADQAPDAGRLAAPANGDLPIQVKELGEAEQADMLALTAVAYPGFFRAGTWRLGEFYGLYVDGELRAMAGTRMQFAPWHELTTICTHPDHTGRGYSRLLVSGLVARLLASGRRPFLHVESDNHHAIGLYQRWGFVPNRVLKMQKRRRL